MSKSLLLILLLLIVGQSHAQSVLFVDANATGTGDGSSVTNAFTTIQTALNSASAGDSIKVAPATYAESLIWPETSNLTLVATGDSTDTTISGNGTDAIIRIFNHSSNMGLVTIEGFALTGGGGTLGSGYLGSGIMAISADLKLSALAVHDNAESGISVDGGSLNLENSTVWNNGGVGVGGGIQARNMGSGLIQSTKISSNVINGGGNPGGGVYVGRDFTLTIENSTVSWNKSFYGGGGGIVVYGTLNLVDVTIHNNDGGWSNGGGIYLTSAQGFSSRDIRVIDNVAAYGGGIATFSSDSEIRDAIIVDNRAYATHQFGGGGVHLRRASPQLIDVLLMDNVAEYDGGGIQLQDTEATLDSLVLVQNRATQNGDGIYFRNSTAPQGIHRSVFVDNGEAITTPGVNGTVSASSNYWNDASGPRTNGDRYSSPDRISAFVDAGSPLANSPLPHRLIPPKVTTLTKAGDVFHISLEFFGEAVSQCRVYFGTGGYYWESEQFEQFTCAGEVSLGIPTTYDWYRVKAANSDGVWSWFSSAVAFPANNPPVVSFTTSSLTGVIPHGVTFDASGSSDPDGDALTYDWDFGDGSSSTDVVTTHTYSAEGTFTVTLTVSDGIMDVSETVEVVVSTPNSAPTASFVASSTSGQAPHEITFDASVSSDPNGDTLTYTWDFGDGTAGSGASVSHAYSAGGTFIVTLTVSDGSLEDTDTLEVTITPPNGAPTASFTASSTSGQAPHEITFDASVSSDPNGDTLTYTWDFGDGTTGSGTSVSHTYSAGGTFTVTLAVSDGSLEDSETLEVVIAPPNGAPTASFTASSTSGQAPHQIVFNAVGSSDPDGDALTFSWDFGDGNTDTDQVVAHTYTAGGEYEVVLTVSDGALEDTESLTVSIVEPNVAPIATFTPSVTSGTAPVQIGFDASASSDPNGDALSFSWDFGDGSGATGQVTSHQYTSAGDYTVTLEVSDGSLSSTATTQISIASGVGTDSESVPTAFELHGAYPNPFNPSTKVTFSLPQSESVSLWIVDVQGRVVSRLIEGETMPAGNHSVTFDASGLPSGNYIIYMRAGEYGESQGVTLVR